MMIIGAKELKFGGLIPKGYGLAYWDSCTHSAYLYPIPFNLVIRLAREIYYLFIKGLFPDTWYAAIRKNEDEIYRDTWRKAWLNGYDVGKKEVLQLIERLERLI